MIPARGELFRLLQLRSFTSSTSLLEIVAVLQFCSYYAALRDCRQQMLFAVRLDYIPAGNSLMGLCLGFLLAAWYCTCELPDPESCYAGQ